MKKLQQQAISSALAILRAAGINAKLVRMYNGGVCEAVITLPGVNVTHKEEERENDNDE